MSAFGTLKIVSIINSVLPTEWARQCEKHRVQLYYVDTTDNCAGTGKLWPAYEILRRTVEQYPNAVGLVDSTSGNFGVALSKALEIYRRRNSGCRVNRIAMAVTRGLPPRKRQRLIDCGVTLLEANDSLHAMEVAREFSSTNGFVYTRQYWNEANSEGWGPVSNFIADQVPNVGVVAAGVGSGGSCSKIMQVLQERFEGRGFGLRRVAVIVEGNNPVGGVRNEEQLRPGTLPWWRYVNETSFVDATKSMRFTAALWQQEGVYVGTSAGFAAEGACRAVRNLVMTRKINLYRDRKDGLVHVVVPAIDLCWPYREEYEQAGIPFPQ